MQEKTLDNDNFFGKLDTFPARLDALMARHGYSQSDLARLVDTRQSTVQGWLAGAIPRRRTLTELATLFNVSVEWLERGVGPSEISRESEPSQKLGEEREAQSGLAARYGLSNKQLVDLIEMLIRQVLAGELPLAKLDTAQQLLQMIKDNEDASIPR